MAVTAKVYAKGIQNALNGTATWDWDTDTGIKCALVTSSYTPDQDAHDFFDDVSAAQASGTGYTAGGAALGTKAVAYDTGTNIISFDAADVSWSGATITARYAVVYKDTGTASTSPLICYVDFGADTTATNGTFTITWAAGGIFQITVS